MSAPAGVLALWIAADAAPAATAEFVRLALAARAAGRPVEVVDARPAPAAPPPEEAQRHLDALAAAGAAPRGLGPAGLLEALRRCDSLLVLASPRRRGTPALLPVDATWLAATPPSAALDALAEAGQVVRARP